MAAAFAVAAVPSTNIIDSAIKEDCPDAGARRCVVEHELPSC